MVQVLTTNFYINSVLVKSKHNQLIINGNTITLEPLVMSLLIYLAQRQSQVVSSEELLEQIWQGKVVSENALHRIIRQLRKALNDDPANPDFIRTVKKQGYSLVAKVKGLPQKNQSISLLTLSTVLLLSFSLVAWWFWPSPNSFTDIKQVRQVTSLPGIERDPILLPDQKSIIFTHQPQGELYNNVVFKQLNTTDIEYLTDDYLHYANLTLANDNIHMAFVLRDDQNCSIQYAKVSINDKQASEPVTLTNCNFYSQNTLAWSFDAKYLYLTQHDNDTLTSRIIKFDIATHKKQPLFSEKKFDSDYFITPQRGGSSFAFARFDDHSVRIATFDTQNNDYKEIKHWQSRPHISAMSWSADGTSILIAGDNKITRLFLDGTSHQIENAAFKDIDQLITDKNNNIIYSTRDHRVRLKEINLNLTEKPEAFVSNASSDEYAAIYSENDDKIYFLSNRESPFFRIWQKHSQKTSLVNNTFVAARPIRLSDDSQSLLFLTHDHQLAVLSLIESSHSVISQEQEVIGSYNWSNNNQAVYFSQMVNEKLQIFSKNLLSGVVKQVTNDGGYHMQQVDNYLFYNKFNQKGLWRINLNNNTQERLIAEFNQLNYTGWQVINNRIYFRRDKDAIRGLYYYDIKNKMTHTIYSHKEIYLFDIYNDESKILISEKEQLSGDLFIAKLEDKSPRFIKE